MTRAREGAHLFRDEVTVDVVAGKGGAGLVSFRHEKYVPRGGPDGGDGGDGGSVVLVASTELNSLLTIGRVHRYAARDGRPGGPRNRTGGRGGDCVIDVPVGTQVLDAEHGNLLRDLDEVGVRLVVAQGGKGGKGNTRFVSAVRQAPRNATPGTAGELRKLRLELKLVAEVGLLGMPNAGKSTFLSRVTAATPKIADYPFTTLVPQVGIAEVGDYDTLLIADLPGLIEGASEGHGLGHRFLRHVERCGVLLHMVDVSEAAQGDPVEAWQTLERELERYSPELYAKPRLGVGTKHFEDPSSEDRLEALRRGTQAEVLGISSVTGEGIQALLMRARELVRGL